MGKQYVMHHQLMSLIAEIVLDQAIRDYEVNRLYKEIDQALEDRDEKRFLELTDELNMLLKT